MDAAHCTISLDISRSFFFFFSGFGFFDRSDGRKYVVRPREKDIHCICAESAFSKRRKKKTRSKVCLFLRSDISRRHHTTDDMCVAYGLVRCKIHSCPETRSWTEDPCSGIRRMYRALGKWKRFHIAERIAYIPNWTSGCTECTHIGFNCVVVTCGQRPAHETTSNKLRTYVYAVVDRLCRRRCFSPLSACSLCFSGHDLFICSVSYASRFRCRRRRCHWLCFYSD